MPGETMRRVEDLASQRRRRGLTQTDLAVLLGVTQQAVAKWESTGLVPGHRLKALAEGLRVPVAALLPTTEASGEEQKARVDASMHELFADQVVVCFDDLCLHYLPTVEEMHEFWRDLQRGGLAHLSAGPVQVMINVAAAIRIDLSEDPPLSSYKPEPISPTDDEPEEDDESGERKYWFDRAEARVYVRGVSEPYSAPQTFFDSALDETDVTQKQLLELHDKFEHSRPDQHSIFDLFDSFHFSHELDESEYDTGQRLHPNSLHVFQSEDYDSCPQRTWVHTKDIRVIEVPTRLWNLHNLSVHAHHKASESRASPSPAAAPKRRARQRRKGAM